MNQQMNGRMETGYTADQLMLANSFWKFYLLSCSIVVTHLALV